jgi:hypothetical protein
MTGTWENIHHHIHFQVHLKEFWTSKCKGIYDGDYSNLLIMQSLRQTISYPSENRKVSVEIEAPGDPLNFWNMDR